MSLTEEGSSARSAVRATKVRRDKAHHILGAAAEIALIVKYGYSLSLFNVTCYNHNYHSGISIVVFEVLLINIDIFKLSILNQHRCIVSSSNRLPAIFSSFSIHPSCILE
jgi:hypothetical protein